MKAHTPKTLVLCEGKEDMLVMQGLARHAALGELLEFQNYGGETKLRAYLANLKVSPEYSRGEYNKVLVTRDADKDFSSAWQSVADSIRAVFSDMPAKSGEWITSADGVQIAAWIIPGPGQTGMIETLCLDAARSNSPETFMCLDPFVECLGRMLGEPPHEKVRFALWTIIAQGKAAKDRLSVELALKRISIPWEDEKFSGLRNLLAEIAK